MDTDVLDKAIFDKYIEPTKKPKQDHIGVEIELPVVSLKGEPVDEGSVIEVSADFREKFGFAPSGSDDNGCVNSMTEQQSGDNLSFDCCYSNLELSFGKALTIGEINERFKTYYAYLQQQLSEKDLALTGMGINPGYAVNNNRPVPNERYRMLYHYLHSYRKYVSAIDMRFHEYPEFGTFTSASQVQLDVRYDELIQTLNVFSKLEPYKSVLFANSYMPEYPDLLCSRNMLWERSMQGYNPHNVGMFCQELKSIGELIEYIKSQSIYCTMRDGKYIDFEPVTVREYFSAKKLSGEYFDGKSYRSIEFSPQLDDIQYLRTFKFEDLTFRGTIEYRSSCCQPVSEAMTVAAFHTGLAHQLDELEELLKSDTVIYSHGYSAKELADMLSRKELPAFIDKKALSQQLVKILDIAAKGLKTRGLGEEDFLSPLYERALTLKSPAAKMLEQLSQGKPMADIIKEYGEL